MQKGENNHSRVITQASYILSSSIVLCQYLVKHEIILFSLYTFIQTRFHWENVHKAVPGLSKEVCCWSTLIYTSFNLSSRSFSSMVEHGLIWIFVCIFIMPCLLYWGGELQHWGFSRTSSYACSLIEVREDKGELRTGSDPRRTGECSGDNEMGPGFVLHLFISFLLFKLCSWVCRISLCSNPWLIMPYGSEIVFLKSYWKKKEKI